jgi:aminomuconate-semialdehyde/2-hydroxymuconate-6-semialdehyde dehydrogenase
MITLTHYINGEQVAPIHGKTMDVVNPSTGKVYAQLPLGDEADVERAYQAASAAFPSWSKMSIDARSAILSKIADLIDQNLEELARAEAMDNGKPLKLARHVDIPRASSNMRFFAHAITQFSSESHFMEHEPAINYTLRRPYGVVGCISPWNLPLYLFTWKIAPALATGNCVVAKPSEITPYTAYLFGKICQEAGLPPGVLNIVHGNGPSAGNPLVAHPNIPVISFTGGTATGKHIASVAAPMFKKLSLELGGKNPNIIFEDADLELAIKTTIGSSFANQGQICLCGSRVFVHRSIYETFRNQLVQKVASMRVGDPFDETTQTGAVVSEAHMNKVLSYIELAKEEGGRILCGGHRVHLEGENKEGFFIQPTIIEGLSFQCRTNQEEIFGPVITIMPFDTEEEVIEMANSTVYGLAASIWTRDVNRAHRVAEELKSGIVWVNCWLLRDLRTPFGGMKASGVGREGGWEAIRFFTEPKNVCIKY